MHQKHCPVDPAPLRKRVAYIAKQKAAVDGGTARTRAGIQELERPLNVCRVSRTKTTHNLRTNFATE